MKFPEWLLDSENKESKKLTDIVTSHAKKLEKALKDAQDKDAQDKDAQYNAVYAFYRKYYTLTLCKSCISAGINKSPTRDIILDFPWKELNQNRIFCLKIWEKINH